MLVKQFFTKTNFVHLTLLLTILSMLDSIFTHYGIRHNYIEESNPLMAYVYYSSIPLFFSIKMSLPLLLLIIPKKITAKDYFHRLMLVTIFLYACILLMHIIWITTAVTIILTT